MFYIWLICLALFIIFSSIAVKQGIEEEKGKTFKSSVFFAAGNFIFFFISIIIPLVSKKVYWAWGLIPIIFRTPLGFLFYLPVWYFFDKFTSNKICSSSYNKKTIKENCLHTLAQLETEFKKTKKKDIPEVFNDISQKIINTELKTTSKDNPEIIVLSCITAYCLQNLSNPNLTLKSKSNLIPLLDFATELSYKKNLIPEELYNQNKTLLKTMYLSLIKETSNEIKKIDSIFLGDEA